MNEDRNHNRAPKQRKTRKLPDQWMQDLDPNHRAGLNIGPHSDEQVKSEWTAFHLRKRGLDVGAVNDAEAKQIPLVADGERLQQGATYIDLTHRPFEEFTARGDIVAADPHAYAPKDMVPYEVWNRLIGEPKPGKE